MEKSVQSTQKLTNSIPFHLTLSLVEKSAQSTIYIKIDSEYPFPLAIELVEKSVQST